MKIVANIQKYIFKTFFQLYIYFEQLLYDIFKPKNSKNWQNLSNLEDLSF